MSTCKLNRLQNLFAYIFHMRSLGTEEFFMSNHPDRIYACFMAVFDTTEARRLLAAREKEVGSNMGCDDDDVDELAVDEQRAYRAKCTKWIRAALSSIEDIAFWYVLFASHHARRPLQHFFNALSKHGPEGLSRGCGGPTRDLPIVKLVCEYSDSIQKEFISLIDSFDHWSNEALILAVDAVGPHHSRTLSDEETVSLRAMAMRLILHNYSAFMRRISNVLDQSLGVSI